MTPFMTQCAQFLAGRRDLPMLVSPGLTDPSRSSFRSDLARSGAFERDRSQARKHHGNR
jgi:hypothetical protein